MKPYYEKDGITIYHGDSQELLQSMPRMFETILFDPPFTASTDRLISVKQWLAPGGKILMLGLDNCALFGETGFIKLITMLELRPRAELGHPVARPVELIKQLLGYTDQVILDPFMGIGSTLIAAKQLRRSAVGIERDEKYCRTAVERIEAA